MLLLQWQWSLESEDKNNSLRKPWSQLWFSMMLIRFWLCLYITFVPILIVLTSLSLYDVSLFNIVSLFHFKHHYESLKNILFIRIKLDLITCRDMPEKRRQNVLIKNLD